MHSDNNALNVFKRSAFKLLDCIQVLEVLSASTEDQFLDIGTRLSTFYERSAKVSSLSGTIVGFMSGDDITRTIEGLSVLMEGFVVHLKHFDFIIGDNITKLNSISDRMEDVEWHLEDMDRITRTLGGLGLSIRVQNAVLKRPVEGIRVLGEDVKKLSSDITEKSAYIVKDTKTLSEIVHSSRLRISELNSAQKNKAAKIFRSTMSDIGSLKEKYSRSASSALEISSCSGEISQCIREIVTFIQFHDITRQQFELSRKAFVEMAVVLEGSSGEDALPQTAANLAEFCLREGAPLYNTRSDFISIVMTVIENLKALSESVNNLLREVRLLVSEGSSMTGSFLKTIDESLSSVNLTVSAFSAGGIVKGELSDATAVVVNTLGKITGFIQAIEYIGDEIELIAFNAAVRADQIGEEGRALGVVADEIQRISAEAQLHTSSMTGILKNVGSYAEELSTDVGTGERDFTLKTSEMSKQFAAFVGHLRDLNRKLISAIRDIEETGEGLVQEIDEVIGSICIHKDVDIVIEGALSNLREIVSDIHMTFPDIVELRDGPFPLSSHEYDLMLEAEVKLLQSRGKAGTVGTRSDDLGDNVEFF
jgi:methyl-accepting chemotaxis protein